MFKLSWVVACDDILIEAFVEGTSIGAPPLSIRYTDGVEAP